MIQSTKQSAAIVLTEDQYQQICLKSGIITNELKASVQMAISKSKNEAK